MSDCAGRMSESCTGKMSQSDISSSHVGAPSTTKIMSQPSLKDTIRLPTLSYLSFMCEGSGPKVRTSSHRHTVLFKRPRPKAVFLLSVILIAFGFGIRLCTGPEVHEPGSATQHSLHAAGTPELTSTGTLPQNPPQHIHVESLDTALLPGASNLRSLHEDRVRRLIFIGDIHGCIEELQKLLTKVDYDDKHDHIVSTGDMINKGPNSHAVLDLLSSKHASCVRGNHDEKILKLVDSAQGDARSVSATTGDPEYTLAATLTSSQLTYLRSCPIILNIGKIGQKNFVVVHGGLVPSLSLDQQDRYHVMNMRIIETATHQPSKEHEKVGFVPWSSLWQEYQQRPAAQDGRNDRSLRPAGSSITTVVYGHDAKKGLQIKQFSKGLDSGCVKGKKLTAFIVDEQGEEEVVQVKCRDHQG